MFTGWMFVKRFGYNANTVTFTNWCVKFSRKQKKTLNRIYFLQIKMFTLVHSPILDFQIEMWNVIWCLIFSRHLKFYCIQYKHNLSLGNLKFMRKWVENWWHQRQKKFSTNFKLTQNRQTLFSRVNIEIINWISATKTSDRISTEPCVYILVNKTDT